MIIFVLVSFNQRFDPLKRHLIPAAKAGQAGTTERRRLSPQLVAAYQIPIMPRVAIDYDSPKVISRGGNEVVERLLSQDHARVLDVWVRSIGSRRERSLGAEGDIGGWGDFWIGDPSTVGLQPLKRAPCAFSPVLEALELEEGVSLAAMVACLGFSPAQFVVAVAGCCGAENHRIPGELTLRIAERYTGQIDFGGSLLPCVRL